MARSDIDPKNPPPRRIGAKVLVLDRQGRILLVDPTYTDGWQLPGGGVEQGESVADAAMRELREETGLDRRITHFAAMDQVLANPETGEAEGYNFVCVGGTLDDHEADAVSVPAEAADELTACAWVHYDELDDYVNPHQVQRFSQALTAIERGNVLPLLMLGQPVAP